MTPYINCRACRHFDPSLGGSLSKCASPNRIGPDGELDDEYSDWARRNPFDCGPSARWFEEIPPPPKIQ